jgi:TolA-binding protein
VIRPAALLLVTGALLAGRAVPASAAPDGSAAFERASGKLAAGDVAGAAADMVALADRLPDDPLADDALFSAGQLYEERLGDPARAAELYRRLIDRYPDSRVSLAAERRLATLREALGPNAGGARALGEMNQILHGHPDRAPAESIAMMERLVADNPDWPGLPAALLWLGNAYDRAGRRADAEATFAGIADRWPADDRSFEALRRAAEVAAKSGRYDVAAGYVDRMDPGGDPGRARSVRDTRRMVDRERLRSRLYRASFAVLALVVVLLVGAVRLTAGSWRATARSLARPPAQVAYMVPVALLLGASALTGHEEVAPAVFLILAGGVAIAWLHGAAVRPARRRWLVVAPSLAAVAGVVAICYIAVHRTRLIDLIVSTVRFGPDV